MNFRNINIKDKLNLLEKVTFSSIIKASNKCFKEKIAKKFKNNYYAEPNVKIQLLLLGLSISFKARCHTRFQRAFTSCCRVFKEITLVGSNQRNYFENANACSKRTVITVLEVIKVPAVV